MILTKRFNNGLRLVGYHMPDSYTVSVGVFVNVGSTWESGKNNGYSHFIEHLLFKGTTTRNYLQISECMDDIGAQLNAFTSKDSTCFYTKSASTDIDKCIELLSDLYFNSVFDSNELEKEKSVVLEEISMNDDNAESVAQDVIMEAMYGNVNLGQTILGNAENINYSDRHSILEFKKCHYIPANTVISIAGNFDCDKVIDKIDKMFNSNYLTNIPFEPTVEPTAINLYNHISRTQDVEQCHIFQAYNCVPLGHKDAQTYSLMSSIFGGGMSSRLFQIVREEHGLAYSVYSYPSLYKNNGMLELYCATNVNNVGKLAKLLDEVKDKIVSGGITEAELNRAKAQSRNGLFMSLENNLSIMRSFGRRMLKLNEPFNIEENVAMIDAVTKNDIQKCVENVFSQPFASCYVGKDIADSTSIAYKK